VKRELDVVLLTAEKRELPFRLALAEVSTSVEVSASAAQLQTGDASGGANFDSLQASEYSLNGRQVYTLMELTPTCGWDTTANYVINGGVLGAN
jgi:hypothetical protein